MRKPIALLTLESKGPPTKTTRMRVARSQRHNARDANVYSTRCGSDIQDGSTLEHSGESVRN
jgi:hypothetical protein